MKVSFQTILLSVDGDRLMDGESPVTLRKVAVEALMAVYQDEQSLSGEDKLARFILAREITKAASIGHSTDLKAEDVALIKKLISKSYGPVIVGPAWTILEGDDQDEAKGAIVGDSNGNAVLAN